MIALIPRSLTAGDFTPFGDVLSFDEKQSRLANKGDALRSDLRARLAFSAGEPRLALYRVGAQRWPVLVADMECHPNASQAFLPVTAGRYLVVAAPALADGFPDDLRCQAFVGERSQGFNYRPGVWHAPIVALEESGNFLMLIWEQGGAADCRTARLIDPIQINARFD